MGVRILQEEYSCRPIILEVCHKILYHIIQITYRSVYCQVLVAPRVLAPWTLALWVIPFESTEKNMTICFWIFDQKSIFC